MSSLNKIRAADAPTLTATPASASSVTISWPAVFNADSYVIYRAGVQIYAGSLLTFTDSGLASGNYAYTASSVRAAAGEGPQSAITTGATATALPVQVTGLTASAASISQINLSWSVVSGATSYTVRRAGLVVASGVTGLTYLDTGLATGTSYSYTVAAVNAAGEGAQSASVAVSTLVSTASAPFPMIAGQVNTANSIGFQSTALRAYAKLLDIIVFGVWVNWDPGHTITFAGITSEIKTGSLAPNGTQVGQYVDIYRSNAAAINNNTYLVTTNNWGLKTSFPAGSQVLHNGSNDINFTAGGPTDSKSRTCQQYWGDYIYDWQYAGGVGGDAIGTNGANPTLDFTWFDDWTFQSQDGGDYDRDGVNDSNSTTASDSLRAGWRAAWDRLKTKSTTIKVWANLSQMQSKATAAQIAEFAGYVTGGGMEGMLGVSYSIENFQSWPNQMASAITQRNSCVIPTNAYYMHSCLSFTGKDPNRSTTAGQATRYGLANAMALGVPWCPCPNGAADAPTATNVYDGQYLVNFWADELAVTPGSNQCRSVAQVLLDGVGRGWAGDPLDTVPYTTRDAQGLVVFRYRRRTTGKLVYIVINPKGNVDRTWIAPEAIQALQGVTEISVNNGATVATGASLLIPVNDARFWLQV